MTWHAGIFSLEGDVGGVAVGNRRKWVVGLLFFTPLFSVSLSPHTPP